MLLMLRVIFALAVTAVFVALMANGEFGAAVFSVLAGVWLRRVAETGRLQRAATRLRP